MSKRLPVEIDPFRLIEQRRLLNGQIPVKQFPRLKDYLATDAGDVDVQMDFDRTEVTHLPLITGSIKAELALVCQRCLKPVKCDVKSDLEIVLVKTDAQAESIQQDYDTWLVEDDRIFLQDFIEDEILLVLPHSASHDICEPDKPLIEALPDEYETDQVDDENPFAVLKNLKN